VVITDLHAPGRPPPGRRESRHGIQRRTRRSRLELDSFLVCYHDSDETEERYECFSSASPGSPDPERRIEERIGGGWVTEEHENSAYLCQRQIRKLLLARFLGGFEASEGF
jgi:hypothetical protein